MTKTTTTETAWTPGPWNYRINMVDSPDHLNGSHAGYYVEARETGDGPYWRVAEVFGQKDKSVPLVTRHGYDEANARLIAASPCLLAVVQAAEKWAMLTQTDPVPWLDDATSAIAKATGGAS